MADRPAEPAGRGPTAAEVLAAAVDAALPQTQCTSCGYAGCRPYAAAIARDGAPINRCPPGGRATIARLAELTGRPAVALDPSCGAERPRRTVRIDPLRCIGCTLCIQACPVDAIAGAPRRLHAVLADDCTGCGLCLPPCPVDCIDWVELPASAAAWTPAHAGAARARHDARTARLARLAAEAPRRRLGEAQAKLAALADAKADAATARKRAVIEAAIARARERLAAAAR